MWWLLSLVAFAGEPTPSDATLIYYNARLALREDRPIEATRLWLLRNALENATERVSSFDDDFASVTWVALGELGLCQDGHKRDDDGAGLWPLAMHNWVVQNRGRSSKARKSRPFRAFEVGRQQRHVAITDVLGSEELRSVSFYRGACLEPRVVQGLSGGPPWVRLRDRYQATGLLRYLLERSSGTLSDDVRGQGVIEARLFDVHLQLMALSAQRARRKAREQSRMARMLGMGRPSAMVIRQDADPYTFSNDSEPARILRECQDWSVDEWMALTDDRRLYLYDRARTYLGSTEALDRLPLQIIDRTIGAGDGEQVAQWIARASAVDGGQRAVWGGDRGRRLLALDVESGFGERAVIALQRGVQRLQSGELDGALRSLSYAVQHAPESSSASDVRGLALRWLSYVAAQFEITDRLLVTLQELLPRRDYSSILEDLMWSAALRADNASFERGLHNQVGRGALGRRVAMLRPLAKGDAGAFIADLEIGLDEAPGETLRLLDRFVQRLEREDADVRQAQRPTLIGIRRLVEPLADPTAQSRQGRRASALQSRTLAILQGLGGLGPGASERDDARNLAPTGEVFAGSVRLAPSDALPWPFPATQVPPPPVFSPLELRPVEWRDDDGEWVFGWRIRG